MNNMAMLKDWNGEKVLTPEEELGIDLGLKQIAEGLYVTLEQLRDDLELDPVNDEHDHCRE